jgi:hypothetical protein
MADEGEYQARSSFQKHDENELHVGMGGLNDIHDALMDAIGEGKGHLEHEGRLPSGGSFSASHNDAGINGAVSPFNAWPRQPQQEPPAAPITSPPAIMAPSRPNWEFGTPNNYMTSPGYQTLPPPRPVGYSGATEQQTALPPFIPALPGSKAAGNIVLPNTSGIMDNRTNALANVTGNIATPVKGNGGGGGKETDCCGQILLSLQKIIDILSDISDKLDGLGGGKHGMPKMTPATNRIEPADPSGMHLPPLIPMLPSAIGGAAAARLGSKVKEDAQDDLDRANEENRKRTQKQSEDLARERASRSNPNELHSGADDINDMFRGAASKVPRANTLGPTARKYAGAGLETLGWSAFASDEVGQGARLAGALATGQTDTAWNAGRHMADSAAQFGGFMAPGLRKMPIVGSAVSAIGDVDSYFNDKSLFDKELSKHQITKKTYDDSMNKRNQQLATDLGITGATGALTKFGPQIASKLGLGAAAGVGETLMGASLTASATDAVWDQLPHTKEQNDVYRKQQATENDMLRRQQIDKLAGIRFQDAPAYKNTRLMPYEQGVEAAKWQHQQEDIDMKNPKYASQMTPLSIVDYPRIIANSGKPPVISAPHAPATSQAQSSSNNINVTLNSPQVSNQVSLDQVKEQITNVFKNISNSMFNQTTHSAANSQAKPVGGSGFTPYDNAFGGN